MPPLNQFKRFDVSKLIPNAVEPLPEILHRVEARGVGEGLLVIAPFMPSPLAYTGIGLLFIMNHRVDA